MLFIKNVKTLLKYLPNSSTNSNFSNSKTELVDAEILIQSKKIQEINFKNKIDISSYKDLQIIDGKSALLAPGLIDPQVHFREPGGEYKETLETGSKSAARGGFTTVITMPNTNPTTDNADVVKLILDKAKKLNITRILPTGSVTKGLLGAELTDFAALKKAGIIALTDDGKGIQSDQVMLEAMKLAAKNDLMILDHSEDEKLSNKGAIHLGEVSRRNNIAGIDSKSESEHVRRGCEYSKITGCHFHVLHISTIESLEHVKAAKSEGSKVTCEVSPHHLLLCDEDIIIENGVVDANFKMNPPLRSRQDMEACQKAFISGEIDFIATDHAPHTEEEKSRAIGDAPFGIVGLETAFGLLYTYFVKTGKISLQFLVNKMTIDAAKVYKLDLGDIKVGGVADLTLIDLEAKQKIDPNKFFSKGRNTPFKNWEIQSDPVMTIFEGRIVYRSDKI